MTINASPSGRHEGSRLRSSVQSILSNRNPTARWSPHAISPPTTTAGYATAHSSHSLWTALASTWQPGSFHTWVADAIDGIADLIDDSVARVQKARNSTSRTCRRHGSRLTEPR